MKQLFAFLIAMHSFAAYSLELEKDLPNSISIDVTPVSISQHYHKDFALLSIDTSYTSNADIEKILVNPLNITSDSFHFSGQVTIHQSNNFNIAMTASHNPELNSNNANLNSHLGHKQLNIEQQNTSHYGLVGSYLLSPSWQVSGGIVHSVPTTELNKTYQGENTNSIALIGTTYSF